MLIKLHLYKKEWFLIWFIYQLILGEKIVLNDLVFIDKPLYNSMKHLVSMKEECADNIALCEIYFTFDYEDENGRFHQEDLIENGRNVVSFPFFLNFLLYG